MKNPVLFPFAVLKLEYDSKYDRVMTDSARPAIHQPLQQRSRATANKVLDALDALLREKPLDAIGIQELVRAAGVSVSSIYARFRDKHAMVLALHERVVAQLTAEMQALAEQDFSSWDLAVITHHVIGYYLAFARRHQHIYRAVVLSGDALIYERVMAQERLASQLAGAFLLKRMQPPPPDLELRVDVAVRVVAATLQQTWVLDSNQPTRFALDDDALVQQLTHLVMGYLTCN